MARVLTWAREHAIDLNRIVVGEYGVNRLMPGAKEYLADSNALFSEYGFMHAFYSFREPDFARMDYELGNRQKIYPYWQAIEQNVSPPYNSLSDGDFLPALGLKPLALKKPLRGFSTWNWFGPHIDQQIVTEVMDAMNSAGLLRDGYDTIIVDGGWRSKHLVDGKLVADNDKFPDGIKSLVDKAHARGFKFGLHIPIGTKDCAMKTPGTFGHERINVEQLKSWGVDLVKLDQCVLDESEQWPQEMLRSTFAHWHSLLKDSSMKSWRAHRVFSDGIRRWQTMGAPL